MNPSSGYVFRGDELKRMAEAGGVVYTSAAMPEVERPVLTRKAAKRKRRPKSKAHYGTW